MFAKVLVRDALMVALILMVFFVVFVNAQADVVSRVRFNSADYLATGQLSASIEKSIYVDQAYSANCSASISDTLGSGLANSSILFDNLGISSVLSSNSSHQSFFIVLEGGTASEVEIYATLAGNLQGTGPKPPDTYAELYLAGGGVVIGDLGVEGSQSITAQWTIPGNGYYWDMNGGKFMVIYDFNEVLSCGNTAGEYSATYGVSYEINVETNTPGVKARLVPIPEPSTLALFATGISSLIGYTWRRWR